MSWWLKSKLSQDALPTTQEPEKTWAGEPMPHSHPSPSAAQASESSKSPLSRDERMNQELIAWLKEAEADLVEKREVAAGTKTPKKAAPRLGDADISEDSIYPTEISCRSAFDYAFFCQSFGGQFVNLYRYGTWRKCTNHWDDFWLCMRTRQWEKTDRERSIREHYRKKAVKYKQGPSSEDVWTVRTEAVKDAFQGNLEQVEEEIRRWTAENPDVKAPFESVV